MLYSFFTHFPRGLAVRYFFVAAYGIGVVRFTICDGLGAIGRVFCPIIVLVGACVVSITYVRSVPGPGVAVLIVELPEKLVGSERRVDRI